MSERTIQLCALSYSKYKLIDFSYEFHRKQDGTVCYLESNLLRKLMHFQFPIIWVYTTTEMLISAASVHPAKHISVNVTRCGASLRMPNSKLGYLVTNNDEERNGLFPHRNHISTLNSSLWVTFLECGCAEN